MTVRVITTPLRGASLAGPVINGSPDERWYVRLPSNAAEWRARAAHIRNSLVVPDSFEALEPAFNASGVAASRLQTALRSGFAVTAGQQPGLFGGPLYTWWKALSALALADKLQELTGIPTVPVFWAASDDADFVEASSTVVSTNDGAITIAMEHSGSEGVPMAQVPLGDLGSQLSALTTASGSAPNSAILDLVKRAYDPSHTVGSAYVQLLRAILEPLGIAVLDAAHPAVRQAGMPVLRDAIKNAKAIEDSLDARARELKADGHSAQVKLVKNRTLVFSDMHGKRDRIRFSESDRALSDQSGFSMGPNVLLRPIVERSILPTVAYLGGPGEISYFAQVSAVASALKVPAPLIMPRWSGVVVEPRVEKILQRYDLSVEDFRDPHAVETRLARESIPAELRTSLTQLQTSIEKAVSELQSSEGSDLVAPSVLEGLKHNVAHRVDRLERRFAASVKRRGNGALKDAQVARGSLFPMGQPQERALNGIPLLARHGDELIEKVLQETRAHAEKLA